MDNFLLEREIFFNLHSNSWDYDLNNCQNEIAVACNTCWGRGRPRPPLEDLLLPLECKQDIAKQEQAVLNVPAMPGRRPRVKNQLLGRGRARTLREQGDVARDRRPDDSPKVGQSRRTTSPTGSITSVCSDSALLCREKQNMQEVPVSSLIPSDKVSGFGLPEWYIPPRRSGLPADYVDYSGHGGILPNVGASPKRAISQPLPQKTLENFPLLPTRQSAEMPAKIPVTASSCGSLKDVICQENTAKQPKIIPPREPAQLAKSDQIGLEGLNIIVVENLPAEVQDSGLRDFFESFGTVEELVLLQGTDSCTVNVRMNQSQDCSWILQILADSDSEIIFPGSGCQPLKCYLKSVK